MVEEHEVSCIPGIPVTRTMDSPLQDNVVAPEAQGIHATIEVEDGGVRLGPDHHLLVGQAGKYTQVR